MFQGTHQKPQLISMYVQFIVVTRMPPSSAIFVLMNFYLIENTADARCMKAELELIFSYTKCKVYAFYTE